MTDTAVLALAAEFFAAVEAGDTDRVSDLYRDDVLVWHNWDDVEQTKSENLGTLSSIGDRYDSFGYTEARDTVCEGGFLRQHVIVAARDGREARVPAVLRVYVDDGRIWRIEEYFDRGQLTTALAA